MNVRGIATTKLTPLVIITTVIIFVLAAVVVPKILIRDTNNLTPEEIQSAKMDTYTLLDNPIQKLWIIETAVVGKEGDTVRVNVYTFFGIRFATIAASPVEVTEIIK